MTTAQPDSAVGNLAMLEDGQVLLPGFITRQAAGLFVDLAALDARELLLRFVDRVFDANARFVALDYPLFLKLAFELTPRDMARWLDEFEHAGKAPQVRLCADIVPFPAERQALYRGLKLAADGATADYLFEQITIEREIETPVPSEPGVSGEPPVPRTVTSTTSERVRLDFDEFVAAVWRKGLRYGIDAALVAATLAADRTERLTIARRKDLSPGRDASIEERTDALHRDDTPHILPDGRMDLRKFRNRFPQVSADTPLVRKLPRVDGVSGWTVTGKELPPPPPKDFDIDSLAGPGTRVERNADGEFVVAARDGFLNIDTRSSQLSISEKIINREGVSSRTTGDLALAGEEFEEHGEVQERRVVEGRHMTFFAGVFGAVRSDGGRVVFKSGISGGSATNTGGSIHVEGTASQARLEARHGEIGVATAENSLIVARSVRIGRAVRCDIVADEADIEQAEGCAIAAKSLRIGTACASRDAGTVVSLILPDLEGFDKQIESVRSEQAEAEAGRTDSRAAMEKLGAEPEIRAYLSLQAKLKAGELVMNAARERQWTALEGRVAPHLRAMTRLHEDMQGREAQSQSCAARIAALQQERDDALAALRCTIENVTGETLVRRRPVRPGEPALAMLGARDLHIALREAGDPADRIFRGEAGCLVWPPAADQA